MKLIRLLLLAALPTLLTACVNDGGSVTDFYNFC